MIKLGIFLITALLFTVIQNADVNAESNSDMYYMASECEKLYEQYSMLGEFEFGDKVDEKKSSESKQILPGKEVKDSPETPTPVTKYQILDDDGNVIFDSTKNSP